LDLKIVVNNLAYLQLEAKHFGLSADTSG
jgi:hypothetical protein